jgi:hypothetical protein
MDFQISKQSLKGLFSSLKKHIVREMAEPIARKLGKSTAEIINTKGQIEIEGRFIASSVSVVGKTTPYDVGNLVSEQVEKEILLTFVTRDDGKVCATCETFKVEHNTLSTANDNDMELLTNNNIFIELERQAFSLHKNCRCQVVRGVEKRAK